MQAFGRRTLLLWGHTGMFFAYLLMSIFVFTGVDIGVLIMICVFLLIY